VLAIPVLLGSRVAVVALCVMLALIRLVIPLLPELLE